ncbi:MAG: hypothetical protein FJ288_19160 [Planctomycetes bacterium]|nr:hypothetical protein [Planctomycetota bacterium]
MWAKHRRLIILAAAAAVLAAVLAGVYWPASTGSLVREAQSGSGADRLAAIQQLGRDRSAEAVEALASMARDPDAAVAAQAVASLGRMRRAEALPPVKAALHDTRPEVREAGAIALGYMGKRTDPQTLAAALRSDPSADVRAAAARSLGLVRYWEAMPDLLSALADPSEDVRREAGAAVRRLFGRDFLYRADDPPDQRAMRIAFIRSMWEDYQRSPMYERFRWGSEPRPSGSGAVKENRP